MTSPADPPLYPSEDEVARLVLGGRAKEWRNVVAIWERQGFPAIEPITGGRYWPAVRAWLDRRYGLAHPMGGPAKPDGVERWKIAKAAPEVSNGAPGATVRPLHTGARPRSPSGPGSSRA